ncbi:myb family transcription factor PHL8-like [Andrographis paniculata]|uniref:myb family transcription factor PHL8-like n=1 Tax=Andrographis paniculata TaxID=175694 RepID=UPI0021E9AD11|nr:myb family transcription factor PHL8-like [Andrographis paniculata]
MEIENENSDFKKPRYVWTDDCHKRFLEAIEKIGGIKKATPNKIYQLMGDPSITMANISSHLQKYSLGVPNPNNRNYSDATAQEIVGCSDDVQESMTQHHHETHYAQQEQGLPTRQSQKSYFSLNLENAESRRSYLVQIESMLSFFEQSFSWSFHDNLSCAPQLANNLNNDFPMDLPSNMLDRIMPAGDNLQLDQNMDTGEFQNDAEPSGACGVSSAFGMTGGETVSPAGAEDA